MAVPKLRVVVPSGGVGDEVLAPEPVEVFGLAEAVLDPVLVALSEAGFGLPGEVLAVNGSGDGFVWVELPVGG